MAIDLSLLVSTVDANFIESSIYKSRGIGEAFATYATTKLYPGEIIIF